MKKKIMCIVTIISSIKRRTLTMFSPATRILLQTIFMFLVFIISWEQISPMKNKINVQKGDARQYLCMAYNLQQHGIFSKNDWSALSIEPTAYRLPGYPLFLSFFLPFNSQLMKAKTPEEASPNLSMFCGIQYIMLFIISLISMIIVKITTKSFLAAYTTFFLVLFDSTLLRFTSLLLTEVLFCFLIMLLSLSLIILLKKHSYLLYIFSGIVLGTLSLTRGHFQYFIPLVVVFFLYKLWHSSDNRKVQAYGICIFFIISILFVQLWSFRNYKIFGRWYLTDRGGIALDTRAEHNMMSLRQNLAAILYFAQDSSLNKLFRKYTREEDYIRLNRRKDNPHSIYRKTRRRRVELLQEYGSLTIADKIQIEEAIEKIKAKPIKHLLACIPFGIRGLHINKSFIISLLLFVSLFGLLIYSNRKKKYLIFIAILPSVFSYLFYTFMTHNIMRYNIPLIPILYIAAMINIYLIVMIIFQYFRKTILI